MRHAEADPAIVPFESKKHSGMIVRHPASLDDKLLERMVATAIDEGTTNISIAPAQPRDPLAERRHTIDYYSDYLGGLQDSEPFMRRTIIHEITTQMATAEQVLFCKPKENRMC